MDNFIVLILAILAIAAWTFVQHAPPGFVSVVHDVFGKGNGTKSPHPADLKGIARSGNAQLPNIRDQAVHTCNEQEDDGFYASGMAKVTALARGVTKRLADASGGGIIPRKVCSIVNLFNEEDDAGFYNGKRTSARGVVRRAPANGGSAQRICDTIADMISAFRRPALADTA